LYFTGMGAMRTNHAPRPIALWPKIRLVMLAFVACVAGLMGFVAFALIYMVAMDTRLGRLSNPPAAPLTQGDFPQGAFDFVLVSLYCFAVGIVAIYYIGRLAPLLTGLLLLVAGAMVAWAVNPHIDHWQLPALGAFGGAVAASIVLPCIYLHMDDVLADSRRRQFSLRGLLLAVVVVSVLFGGLTMRRQYHEYRQPQIIGGYQRVESR
jgi:hypothetical protein